MKLTRPQSIRWFERLFLAAVFGTIFGILVTLREYVEYYSSFTEGQMTLIYVSWGIFLISWITLLLSWYFAARRAKLWAKWTFVVICLLALFIFTLSVEYASGAGLMGYLLIHLLMTMSAGCLFLPSARDWFQTQPRLGDHSQSSLMGND